MCAHSQTHVDPSLMVLEPCPDIPGLEVYDKALARWIEVEDVCIPGAEWVLFGGRCLQRLTGGAIEACTHRVRADARGRRRFCFIYEQKYDEELLGEGEESGSGAGGE